MSTCLVLLLGLTLPMETNQYILYLVATASFEDLVRDAQENSTNQIEMLW